MGHSRPSRLFRHIVCLAGEDFLDIKPFAYDLSEADIRRERNKARQLRGTQWWKRRCAKGRCHYCGRATPPAELTMDHIVPVARGGRSVKGNLVPACKDCNIKKKQMLPMEWEAYLTSMQSLWEA